MKGYKFIKPFTIEEKDILETVLNDASSKVKINKALVTLADVLRYRGDLECDQIVLGGSGIGVVSETDTNLFDLEKGKRVYVDPTKFCDECYYCKSGDTSKCVNFLVAGESYDGFLRDFISSPNEKLFTLPTIVSDFDALFIDQISLAVSIFDRLNIQKGDYVAVLGANNFAIILSQLLIYYQAVPILMTLDQEELEVAKESGIYYALGPNDNWLKEVSAITSGRLTSKVVYVAESNIPTAKAFTLAQHGASVAFTGAFYKSTPVSFLQAIKKHLDILCINSGFGYATTSINLIANKAIDFSHLKVNKASYSEIPEVFKNLSEQFDKYGKINETVIEMN